jgi:uncharacterized membrane protein
MIDDRGSMLPLIGGLFFICLTMLALAVDIGLLHARYRWTASAADLAAEAGGAMIDIDDIYEGRVVLDVASASAAAQAAAGRLLSPGDGVRVEVGSDRICVTITTRYRTSVLPIVGMREIPVTVRSCAEPRTG